MNNDAEEKKDNNAADLEAELQKVKEERDGYLNGWKRAKADFINYQKDESKRSEELMKFAALGVIEDMIPVLDHLNLALMTMKKAGTVESGVEMVRNQMEEVLKKRGLQKIQVSLGNLFDPHVHESVGEIEAEYPPGSVGEIVEQGYILQGRVVRPARVRITKSQ